MRSPSCTVLLALLLSLGLAAPAAANGGRTASFSFGVTAGDVTARSAILWGRADRAVPVVLDVARDRLSRGG